MMTDIVERLRAEAFDAVNWDGETMKQWDKIRKQAETLPGSDLPRLMFQGLIESLAELMVESADEIERLRNDAQSAWQPIETAPRDGLPIELWHHVWACPITAQWKIGFISDMPWVEKTKTTAWPMASFSHWRSAAMAPSLPSAQCQETGK